MQPQMVGQMNVLTKRLKRINIILMILIEMQWIILFTFRAMRTLVGPLSGMNALMLNKRDFGPACQSIMFQNEMIENLKWKYLKFLSQNRQAKGRASEWALLRWLASWIYELKGLSNPFEFRN